MSLLAAFQSLGSKAFRRAAGLALGAVASVALTAGAAQAEPAIWVVKDKDSTIYLFGTVHALRPEMHWRSAKIDQAYTSADELVLEIADLDDTAKAQSLILQYGVDRATPLSSRLNDAEKAKLADASKVLGMSPAMLEPLRPWVVGLQLSVAPLIKAGYDPKSGVELVLKAEADKAGKPVTGLETFEQQIRIFADMTPETELAFLRQSLDDYENAVPMLDGLTKAWSAGDVKGLEKQLIVPMKKDGPALYKLLIVDRNANWANQIQHRLEGKGVTFIAVGAGHLVGPDSVQKQLAKRGIKAKRL